MSGGGESLRRWYACPRCLAEREVAERVFANTLACSPTCPNCHTAAAPVEVSEYLGPNGEVWGREAHTIAVALHTPAAPDGGGFPSGGGFTITGGLV